MTDERPLRLDPSLAELFVAQAPRGGEHARGVVVGAGAAMPAA
jgi:hypothetical protein